MDRKATMKAVLLRAIVKTPFMKLYAKYKRWNYARQLLSPSGEDYDVHWGFLDVKGKTVLDLGADYGSTAFYFRNKGACKVIAVEGDTALFEKLIKNIPKIGETIPINLFVSKIEHIENLILDFNPDIVKVDLEGAETLLTKVSSEIFRTAKEYGIETHNTNIHEQVLTKLRKENYDYKVYQGNVVVVHAVIHAGMKGGINTSDCGSD